MKDNKHIKTFEQHQENLNISDVMKRISELTKEYYELEVSWRKDKRFGKIDRKYEIEVVFDELGIPLKAWE
jgi:hypothetical protein